MAEDHGRTEAVLDMAQPKLDRLAAWASPESDSQAEVRKGERKGLRGMLKALSTVARRRGEVAATVAAGRCSPSGPDHVRSLVETVPRHSRDRCDLRGSLSLRCRHDLRRAEGI